MTEWRTLSGYDRRYLISDGGAVWSTYWDRELTPYLNTWNYPTVRLRRDGRQVAQSVHRLVMAAFVGPCPEGMQVRHLDGDKSNNALSNLAYGTQTENNLDILHHGRNRNWNKTHCPAGHPYDEANTYWRERNGYRHRQCRKCMDAATRRYQARKKVAA